MSRAESFDPQVERALALHQSGMTQREIAEAIRQSTGWISMRLRERLGRPNPRQQKKAPVFDLIVRLARGETKQRIAVEYGCHASALNYRLRRREIPGTPAYFASILALSPEQQERYRIALDERFMNHPDAIDFAWDD